MSEPGDAGGVFRIGDDAPPVQRSPRLYQDAGDTQWYFTTREGSAIGPFASELEAQQALDDFLEFIRLADLPTLVTFTENLTPNDEQV